MPKAFFFYIQQKIDVEHDSLTGAAIKAAIKAAVPSVDLSHELVLEGHGNDPDRAIADGETVSLAIGHGEGPKTFFTRPPTNFG